ncbi:hypothetical protein LCGC14_0316710 [marine sediment metagenome]|uniref:Uncharacterized protein n=1 Tax=marine sediment metagenome TaxID=412755 RepID=A0A0F9TR06_9ZZZZ
MIERTGIIEVEDECLSTNGHRFIVERVVSLQHGLLIFGQFLESPQTYRGFWPEELEPVAEMVWGWNGWLCRGHVTLPNGTRIGDLGLYEQGNTRNNHAKEYDIEWERTLTLIAEENANGTGSALMQSKPLPDMPGVMK